MFCHNHLRNIWVKNVLGSLTEFLRANINASIDEVAPALRVSPCFMSLARSFDKNLVSVQNIPRFLVIYFVDG